MYSVLCFVRKMVIFIKKSIPEKRNNFTMKTLKKPCSYKKSPATILIAGLLNLVPVKGLEPCDMFFNTLK